MTMTTDPLKGGQYKALNAFANPTITSSTNAFVNAHPATEFIALTVRTAVIAVTFDGTTATSTVGIDLATGTHWLRWNKAMLDKIKVISATGTFFCQCFCKA